MAEKWKPVTGYEGLYEVSDQGRVRSVDRTETQKSGLVRHRKGMPLKPNNSGRYMDVQLSKDHIRRHRLVHSLVAEAFLGPRPDGLVIRHLDGNSFNNAASNLAYGTQTENLRDWPKYGGRTSNQKLTVEQVHEIRKLLAQGFTLRSIAAQFGIAHGTVNAIKQNRTFSYV